MTPPAESASPTIREVTTAALRYWEPRRIIYNGVLAAIMVGYFLAGHCSFKSIFRVDDFFGLFLLAVLANVAYCAAYIVDIFVQLSGFRSVWARYRWILFLVGLVFASGITRFFAQA